MKRFAWLLAILLPFSAFAQQVINCAPGVACPTSPGSGVGDPAYIAFGKTNTNFAAAWGWAYTCLPPLACSGPISSAPVVSLSGSFGPAPTSLTNISSIPQWFHVGSAVLYSSLAASATTANVTLFSLPAGGVIHGIKIIQSASFVGGGLTGYTLSVGITAFPAKYAAPFNVFQAPSSSTFQLSNNFGSEDNLSATNILLTATSVGGNTNAATAGSVDVYALLSVAR